MNAGSITFSTELDNKELEGQLSGLKKKILRVEDEINRKQAERAPLVDQSQQLASDLDAAKARLEYMKSRQEAFTPTSITQQAETVSTLQGQWNGVQSQVEKYDRSIAKATSELNYNKEKAGAVAQELAGAGDNTDAMGEAMERANKSMNRFALRMREVVRSALVFTLITQALAKFRDWIGNVIKANAQASEAVARLKAALLTLAQPLVNIIIPAFTVFVNVLSAVVTQLAKIFSLIFGTTVAKSKKSAEALYNQTKAINGTGTAAKKAAKENEKYLASFDEINQIGSKDGETGTDAADTSGIAPDFSGLDTTGTESGLSSILGLIEAIGSALVYMQLPKALQGGLKTALGLFVAIDGAVHLVKDTFDAWVNGVTWNNLFGILGRSLEMVGGLMLAFGKTGAAIGLVVTGINMLVTGFHDAMENGWNLQNLFLSMAGILSGGIGISILTGSWIPLLIAAISDVLLAFTVAWGHGDELLNGIHTALQGFLDFFKGIFTGNVELSLQGIHEVADGLKTAIFSIVDSLKDMFNSFLDWMDEKTGGKLSGIIDFIRGLFNGLFEWEKTNVGVVVDAIEQVLDGLVLFITGVFSGKWDKAWTGIKKVFSGVWDGMIGVVETAINFMISGINWLIAQMNKISFDVPDWVPGIGGKSFGVNIEPISPVTLDRIPALAQGAVIPPNREFLAMLGDQTSGYNYEVPDAKLRKLIQEETGGGNADILQEILAAVKAGKILMLDRRELGRAVYDVYGQESKRVGVSLL